MTRPIAPRLLSLTLSEQRRLVESEIGEEALDWEVWVHGLTQAHLQPLYGEVGQTPAFFPLSSILKASHLSFLQQGYRLEKWLTHFEHGAELTSDSIPTSTHRVIQVWLNQGRELANSFEPHHGRVFFQQKRQFLKTLQAFLDYGAHPLLVEPFSEDDLFEEVMLQEHEGKTLDEQVHGLTPIQKLLRKKLCKDAWHVMFSHLSDEEVLGLASKFNDFDDNLLHNACWLGQVWVLEALHRRGFPLSGANASYQTPLELAIGHQHYQVANWLKQHSPTPPSLTVYDHAILDNKAQLWVRQQQHLDFDVGHALERFCLELRLSEFKALWEQCQKNKEAKFIFEQVLARLHSWVEYHVGPNERDARLDYFLEVIPNEWWNDAILCLRGNAQANALEELSKSPHLSIQRLVKGVVDKRRQQLSSMIPYQEKGAKNTPKTRL